MPELRVRTPVDDAALTALHAAAFGAADGARDGAPAPGAAPAPVPWNERLHRHALTWVAAYDAGELVGFVQVAWDGGAHAFLLDTAVHPAHQRRGTGRALVAAAAAAARDAGCQWLHVDHEQHLSAFYAACGFRPAAAGLLRLA